MNLLFPTYTPAEVHEFLKNCYDYHDGGSFAEILVPQYPGGIGLSAVSASSAASAAIGAPVSSALTLRSDQAKGQLMLQLPAADQQDRLRQAQGGLLVVHTAESALRTKHFTADELAKPQEEERARNAAATQAALEERLRDQANVSGSGRLRTETSEQGKLVLMSDPLKGASRGAKALTIVQPPTFSDPAPVIRSPTKSKQSSEGFSVPAPINNYKNKRGLIFTVEERASAQPSATAATVTLGKGHAEVRRALLSAQQELDLAASERLRSEEEEATRLRELQAHRALEKLKSASAPQSAHRETREERALRVERERKEREEERQETQQLRMRQKAAARLGISLSALEADKALLGAVEGRESAVSEEIDPRVLLMANQSSEGTAAFGENGAGAGTKLRLRTVAATTTELVSGAQIAQEMERLERDGTGKHGRPESSESESDEDVFSVAAALKRTRPE